MLTWDDEFKAPTPRKRVRHHRGDAANESLPFVPNKMLRVLVHYEEIFLRSEHTMAMVVTVDLIRQGQRFREALESFLRLQGCELLSAQLENSSQVLIDRVEEVRAARGGGSRAAGNQAEAILVEQPAVPATAKSEPAQKKTNAGVTKVTKEVAYHLRHRRETSQRLAEIHQYLMDPKATVKPAFLAEMEKTSYAAGAASSPMKFEVIVHEFNIGRSSLLN